MSEEKFFVFIGLEIHCELKTQTKMFCSCKNDPLERHPNVNICPVCLGHPGTLPVINKKAVESVIKTGLALNCEIEKNSYFERKNYFYPDLPKGYQISQYKSPLCREGYLEILIDGCFKKIEIERIHLEEDTGRLIHGENFSLIDFNRAGIPLMELVTKPDIHSGKEARKFAQELQLILRYLDVSDADMEKGQMRIEANLSLSKREDRLGTKVEIKNLNSFGALEEAIDYEIKRQTKILKSKGKIFQETRGWDQEKGITFPQREKEFAHDYRYFPEPDLPPLSLSDDFIEKIKQELPELPSKKRERFQKEYELSEKEIEIFIKNKELADYFEKIIFHLKAKSSEKELKNLIRISTNYLLTDFLGLMKGLSFSESEIQILPENFANLVLMISKEKISSKIAKMTLEKMFQTGKDPLTICQEEKLVAISNEEEIFKLAKEVIEENPKVVEDFKKGKENAIQFLMGKLMQKTKGKANPQIAQEIFKKILKESA